MGRADRQVPDYVTFYTQTEGRNMAPGEAGFLGARFAPMELTTANVPEFLRKQAGMSDLDHTDRAALRDLLGKQFAAGRRADALAGHGEAYERVRGLMASEALFDVAKEPAK